MTNIQLQQIQEHLMTVLSQTSVRDELRSYLENNVILDDEENEVEIDLNSFDWNLSLELTHN